MSDLDNVLSVVLNSRLKDNETIEELKNAIRELVKFTAACTCPNNGGGDCPWCEAAEMAKDLL